MKMVEIKAQVTVDGLTRCLPGCRHLVTDDQAAELLKRDEAVVIETAMKPQPDKADARKNNRRSHGPDNSGRGESSPASSE